MKKRITMAAALCAAAFCLTGAAKQWTAEDIRTLQKGILTTGAPALYDIDQNGVVDVFDLGLLKRSMNETGEVTAQSIPITAENARLQSRSILKDDVLWLIQSGSAAEFTLRGESASLTLAGSSGIRNGADYRPRYAVYVDDELLCDNIMEQESETIELWKGADKTATVKVMLLSEAMYGGVGIRSVEVNSKAASPVTPVAKKALKIGFIGDSITCAYGVEGASQGDSFKTSTENFSKSYAYLTAQKLGADYTTCCYSGHGIVSGYSSDGAKNAESLIPDCYETSSKFADYGSAWDFAEPCDAVVINLGTNDINYVAKDPETRGPEFVDAYKAFLKTVRKHEPDAAIICTVGTMGGDDVYQLIEQAVSECGDARVSCYFSKTHSMADGLGSDWHPSEKTQQNSAFVLADKISRALGMESDMIGLNAADEASYDLVQEGTANAAHYVSDFDKSFWVNTVTGGTAPTDVQAVLSGISLRKGTYRLTFECTGAASEYPVVIRSGKTAVFEGTGSASADGAKYDETFTVDAAYDNAELAFLLGGKDSYSVTLRNISLVRIS
ncbi:MAG: hypothetical protein IKN55_02215 [Oscillospiraceae bacterium]|nr:hypothetical protein [Oscillospiraceae bacterium]